MIASQRIRRQFPAWWILPFFYAPKLVSKYADPLMRVRRVPGSSDITRQCVQLAFWRCPACRMIQIPSRHEKTRLERIQTGSVMRLRRCVESNPPQLPKRGLADRRMLSVRQLVGAGLWNVIALSSGRFPVACTLLPLGR